MNMFAWHRPILFAVGLVLFFLPSQSLWAQAKQDKIDFAHEVVPILKKHCASCHTNGKYKGSVSLDTREDVLKSKVAVPGDIAKSEMIKRITSKDIFTRMPPKGDGLSEKEVDTLQRWVVQGLPWEAGFTFKVDKYIAKLQPRRPQLPPAKEGREHPIDRILDSYYQQKSVPLPKQADDVTFVRRIYMDLLGQLPTPDEVEQFQKDRQPDRYEKLAQRLLAQRRTFTDHWLTFWNDLLRNDYAGTGYIDGGRKQISAWLYQSIYDNKPYDSFVKELINPNKDAEGFIRGIKWRGKVNASQVPEIQFSQNVSLVFLGINMKCASCHDSFINDWKLNDAYGLAAVVANAPLEIHRCDTPTGKMAQPKFLWPELGTIDANAPREKRLAQLADLVTHKDNGRFTRSIVNRIWDRLFGRGLVQPVDIMAGRPWNEDLLDYLAVYLSDNDYDLTKLLEHIVTSRAYRSDTAIVEDETPGKEFVFRGPQIKRMTAEQFLDAVWQITQTAPGKAQAPVKLPAFDTGVPKERQYVRASLVRSNLLMRSLGRPNREQVVTTRPDLLTTLQALDLANGQILYDLLTRGAANLLRSHPNAKSDDIITDVYRSSLGRRPTNAELKTAEAIIGENPNPDGVADLLWCVVMMPEFQLIR